MLLLHYPNPNPSTSPAKGAETEGLDFDTLSTLLTWALAIMWENDP
jgi:hypothetical protein